MDEDLDIFYYRLLFESEAHLRPWEIEKLGSRFIARAMIWDKRRRDNERRAAMRQAGHEVII